MLKNVFKNIMIILVIFCIILASVVSHDEYHLSNCEEDNCPICFVIHVAQAIIIVAFGVVMYKTFKFIITTMKIVKVQEIEDGISNTLILQKTRFNE